MPTPRYSCRTVLCLLALLCSLAGGGVWAQEAPIAPGNRVRVWTGADAQGKPSGKPTVGMLTAWTADSVVLNTRNTDGFGIPRYMVSRIDQSAGRAPQLLKGAGYGLLIGGASGALIGYATGDDTDCFVCFTAEQNAVVGAALLGVAGTVLGAIVGALSPGERWERVSLPAQLSVEPTGVSRATLSASFQF